MKTIPITLILVGMILPGIISAQPETERREKPMKREEGGPPRDRGPGPGRGWKQADTDNSGTISREEFNNMPRIQKLPEERREMFFKRFDKDGDGVLSADELKMMERPPHPGGGREAMMRFRELDTDKSGGVSLVELKAGELFKKLPVEKQEELFKRLDTDGDGEITVKDKPQHPGGKPGGPGKGDRDRGDRPRDPRRMLKDFDENGDGALSFEEFRKAPMHKDLSEDEQEDRFEALDKNSDKKLDETDLPPKPDRGERPGKPDDAVKDEAPDSD